VSLRVSKPAQDYRKLLISLIPGCKQKAPADQGLRELMISAADVLAGTIPL